MTNGTWKRKNGKAPDTSAIRRSRKAELERLLVDLDLTDTELACYCDINRATVTRYMNGTYPVPMAILRMLTLMLKIKQISPMAKVLWHDPREVRDDELMKLTVNELNA